MRRYYHILLFFSFFHDFGEWAPLWTTTGILPPRAAGYRLICRRQNPLLILIATVVFSFVFFYESW